MTTSVRASTLAVILALGAAFTPGGAQGSGAISSVAWGTPQEGVSWNVVVSGTASYPGNLFMVVKDGPATCGSIPILDATYPSSWSVRGKRLYMKNSLFKITRDLFDFPNGQKR